jgi:hypothetical protein
VQAVLDVEPFRDAALQELRHAAEAAALRRDADERASRVEAERVVDASRRSGARRSPPPRCESRIATTVRAGSAARRARSCRSADPPSALSEDQRLASLTPSPDLRRT